MMADDVEIHFAGPAEVPFAGTYRGHEGVGQFAQALGANVEAQKVELTEFIAQDDQVVVLGHETLTARPTGRLYETDVVAVVDGARAKSFAAASSRTPPPSPRRSGRDR